MDISKVKARLNSLQNKDRKSDLIWKPSPGKQIVRIVPYKFDQDNPFIELKFHYNLNGKTYLSPDSFDRPDPIVEFAKKLKNTGDKEEWQFARKLEPKMRTFVPVLVRGNEKEGVKFWGFGKQVYQAILSYIADPDYGDITDLKSGRDLVVEFRTAEETGKSFPETTIRPKPNQTPAVDPTDKELVAKIGDQSDILELFEEPTYDDLKEAMDTWLNEGDDTGSEQSEPKAEETQAESTETENSDATESEEKKEEEPVTAGKATSDMNEVMSDFDKLFDS